MMSDSALGCGRGVTPHGGQNLARGWAWDDND